MPDSGGSGGPGGGSRGGSSDGADYGWLYGGKSGSGQPAGGSGRGGSRDPEPTQVMPKIDRPGSSRGAGSGGGAGGGGAGRGGGGGQPPRQPVKPARTPKAPRRRWPAKKIILTLLVAWLVFLIAVPLWAWSNIEKVDIEPNGDRPSEQPGSNYLLVGSDSRKGLTKEEAKRLGTGSQDVGNRTDTIMLLHTGDGPNLLLSIPRDSIVEHPRSGHQQDQRGLRHRRSQAAGQDDRAEHRAACRPLRGDRLRRVRELGRRRRRDRDLPEAADGRQAGQPPRQEGLPGGRWRHRTGLRAVAQRQPVRRHRPRPAPARGGQRHRLGGEVPVDVHQPDPLLPGEQGGHLLAEDQRGDRTRSRWPGSAWR